MPKKLFIIRDEAMRGFFRLFVIVPALFSYTVFSAPLNPADRNDIQQRQA
ncbi:hypothetical protein PZA22_16300 [Pectobacterium polaris]|nr:hypothetical protein [Pectobacterium polaris]MDE8756048.1 hypothetical protein [Pectobacterium polaris]